MKKKESALSHARLVEILAYDEKAGIFLWRTMGSGRKLTVGSKLKSGYINIWIDQRQYLAHRLAWFYVYKRWPKSQIDHRNMIRDDNRLENLREASNANNTMNRRAQSNNSSGYKGAHKTNKKYYTARIAKDGKTFYLGCFKDPQKANEAYRKAAIELFGEFHRIK